MEGAKLQIQDDAEPTLSTLPESLSDAFRKKLGENKELSQKQEKLVKKFLKKSIREQIEDTGELHRRLEEYNDLSEGVPLEDNRPYDEAPQAHVPVCETYLDVYGAVEKRSILNAATIWYTEVEPGFEGLADKVADIDAMMNWKARNEWNISRTIGDILYPTNRDGLAYMQITWAEEFKKASDVVLVSNEKEFTDEFHSAKDSGIPPKEWAGWIEAARKANDDEPLEVPITFEKRTYYGNKGEVVELADFVSFPAVIPSIKHALCRGYGKRFDERTATIKKKIHDKVYYEKAARKLIKKEKGAEPTRLNRSKNEHEGLSQKSNRGIYSQFELVIRGHLEEDEDGTWGDEQEFLVVYNYDHDELLRLTDYPYRTEFYAPFRIDSRANRQLGKGIPQKVMQMNDMIDRGFNNRMISHEIANVPTFKGKKSSKRDFDAYSDENRWYPGAIFWLEDPDAFKQFTVQPTDQGTSLLDEQNSMKILDMYLGSATSLLSGGIAPGDPSAPGNKTALMIQQSNLRMDSPLDELREGVDEVGLICNSHLYQFGLPQLTFIGDEQGYDGKVVTKTRTIHKKYLRRGLKYHMSGVTVLQNPESELMKGLALYGQMQQVPAVARNESYGTEIIRDALMAGRVPGRKKYLPSPEQIKQDQIEITKAAMQKKEVEEEQARQAQVDARLSNANRDLAIKNTAQKTAQANLGVNGANNG